MGFFKVNRRKLKPLTHWRESVPIIIEDLTNENNDGMFIVFKMHFLTNFY